MAVGKVLVLGSELMLVKRSKHTVDRPDRPGLAAVGATVCPSSGRAGVRPEILEQRLGRPVARSAGALGKEARQIASTSRARVDRSPAYAAVY